MTGQDLKTLKILVQFCVQWYFKLYFDIKVKHLITEAPYHILTSIRILKTQPRKVRDIVTVYVKSSAWYSHSECLLLSLLASKDQEDRKFAVDQILKKRGDQEFGDMSVRKRTNPKINMDATNLRDLIRWDSGEVSEPSFTCPKPKN